MTAEQVDGLIQYLSFLSGAPRMLVIAFVLAAIILWIYWRTRSLHILLARAWQIICGKLITADAKVAEFLLDRHDLMTFRFLSGLPVRTLPKAKQLIEWSRKNDEEIGSIKACGDLFDVEECRIKEDKIPGSWALIAVTFVAILCFYGAVATGVGIWSDRALLQFKESKTWFFLTNDSAQPFSEDVRLKKTHCQESSQNEKIKMPSFTLEEVRLLCNFFVDKEIDEYVQRNVKQQRFLFGLIGIIFSFVTWTCAALLLRVSNAKAMKTRLASREKHTEKQAVDTGVIPSQG